MKFKTKLSLLFVVCLSFLLVGCSDDLPPEPGVVGSSEGVVTVGGAINYATSSFAPPFDINDGDVNIFSFDSYDLTMVAGDSTANVGIDVDQEGGFIYKNGYFYTFDGWEQFPFIEDTVGSSNWIMNSASANLTIDVDDLDDGTNFVVTYSCKKYDGVWKCGCDSAGNCGQWMIQEFELNKFQFPDLPDSPGSLPSEFDSAAIIAENIGSFSYDASTTSTATTCSIDVGTCVSSETTTYAPGGYAAATSLMVPDFPVTVTIMSFDAEVDSTVLFGALDEVDYVHREEVGSELVYSVLDDGSLCFVWNYGLSVIEVCGDDGKSPYEVVEAYSTAYAGLDEFDISLKPCTIGAVDFDLSGVVDEVDLSLFSQAKQLSFDEQYNFYVDESNKIDFADVLAYLDCYSTFVSDSWSKPLVVNRVINAVPSSEFNFQIIFYGVVSEAGGQTELGYYEKAIVAPYNKFQVNNNFQPFEGMVYVTIKDSSYSGEQTIELETDKGIVTVCLPDLSISGVTNLLAIGEDGSTYWLNVDKTLVSQVGATFWYMNDMQDMSILMPLRPGQLARSCN